MANGTSSPSFRIDFAGGAACSNRSCWFRQAHSLSCSLLRLDRISDLIGPSQSGPEPEVRLEESAVRREQPQVRRAERQAGRAEQPQARRVELQVRRVRRAEQPQAPQVRIAEPLVD